MPEWEVTKLTQTTLKRLFVDSSFDTQNEVKADVYKYEYGSKILSSIPSMNIQGDNM